MAAGPGPRSRERRYRGDVEFDDVGGQARIGVVVPFDFNLDWEYWQYFPPGYLPHFTRTPHLEMRVGVGLARRVGRPSVVARATATLRSLKPAAVLYACSSGSFIGGVAGEREIRAAMIAAGAPRAVTSSSAMIDALELTGIGSVALVTPYTASLSRHLAAYVEEAGVDVAALHYLGLRDGIAAISQSTIRDLVRRADGDEADAVFVSCTALRTYGILSELEAELERPVFTANQVSLWAVLVAAGALPRPLDVEPPRWTLGGPAEPSLSSMLLMDAAERRPAIGTAPDASARGGEWPEGGLGSERAG